MLLSLIFIFATPEHVHSYVIKLIVLFAILCSFSLGVIIEILWETHQHREENHELPEGVTEALISLNVTSIDFSAAFVYAYCPVPL